MLRLGYDQMSEIFDDPMLGVRVCFLYGSSPTMELVAPMNTSDGLAGNVLEGWLKRGAKIYHTAYETDEFDQQVASRLGGKGKILVPPTPAVAFDGRRVAFIMMRNGMLIELIDKDR